jgi:hypothetical protein
VREELGAAAPLAAELDTWISTVGPTGVVILSVDGLNLWLGVPTAS